MKPEAWLIAGIAALAGAAIPADTRAPADAQRLAGRWRLNTEQSEDVRQKMHETLGGRRPGGQDPGGGGMPGGGSPGGGHRGGGQRGGGQRPPGGDARAALQPLFEPSPELTISSDENEIVLLEKDGRLRRLHPDGKKYKSDSDSSESKARWEQNQLIVETQSENGPRLSEAFSLDPEGRRLTVLLKLEHESRPSVSVRRVYDAVQEGQ